MDLSDISSELFLIESHSSNILAEFHNQLQNKQFLDFALVIGDDKTEISVHRSMLIASSSYFRRMCSSGMKESIENRIVLNGVTSEAVHQLINFCYTGKLDLNMNNVAELIQAASLLEYESIEQICVDYLSKKLKIKPEICFWVHSIADLYGLHGLCLEANQCAIKNFSKIRKSVDFLTLGIDRITDLLSDDKLSVSKEEEVFDAALSWVNHDKDNREVDCLNVLKCVRFLEISSNDFFNDFLKNIFKSIDCLDIYVDLLHKKLGSLQTTELISDFKFAPRISRIDKLLMIMSCHNELTIKTFCPVTKKCFHKGSITLKYGISANSLFIVKNNKLYFLTFKSSDFAKVTCVDLVTLAVEIDEENSITLPSDCVPVISIINQQIHVFVCGCNKTEDEDKSEDENEIPLENTLFKVIQLPEGIHNPGIAEFQGELYFINGEHSKRVDSFNPNNNTWTSKAAVNEKRYHPKAAVFHGFLYALGGDENPTITTVEKYDSTKGAWSMIQPLKCKFSVHNTSLVTVDDKLIVSGYNITEKCYVVKQYNPGVDQWDDISTEIIDPKFKINLVSMNN